MEAAYAGDGRLNIRMNWPLDWRLFQRPAARYGSGWLSDALCRALGALVRSFRAGGLHHRSRRYRALAHRLAAAAHGAAAALRLAGRCRAGGVRGGAGCGRRRGDRARRAATALWWEARPRPASARRERGVRLLVSMRRMRRIRSVSAEDNAVVAEAGVVLADLHAAVEGQGGAFRSRSPPRAMQPSVASFPQTRAVRRSCASGRCARSCSGWKPFCLMDRCSAASLPCVKTIAATTLSRC